MMYRLVARDLCKWSVIVALLSLGSVMWLCHEVWNNAFMGSHWNLGWLLQGTPQQYQQWFPHYHDLAFWGVRSLLIAGCLAVLAMVYLLFRRCKIRSLFSPTEPTKLFPTLSDNLDHNLRYLTAAVLLSLSAFLLLYFAVRTGVISSGDTTFQDQLVVSRAFALSLIVLIALSVTVKWKSFVGLLKRFFLVADTPYNLAMLRFLYFGFMAVICWFYPDQHSAYFDIKPQGLPYMDWYIKVVNLTREQYVMICKTTSVVNLFICLGFLTRPMLLLNAILIFVVMATPNFYGKLFHEHLWIWIPWILTFSPCSDVLSIDALMRKWFGKQIEIPVSVAYGLPIRLIWITLGVVYFFPGFQKLWIAGFDWALSNSMLNQIYVEWHQHYGWRSMLPVERFPGMVKIGGLSVILFEMAYIFLLLTDKTRWVAISGGVIFHTLTGLTLRIWFPSVLGMYVFYFNLGRVFPKWRAASGHTVCFKLGLQSKLMIMVTSILFFFNSIFGFAAIYSYPFTSFPGYTRIYGDELKFVIIEMKNEEGVWVNVDDALSRAGYRRESDTPYEDAIINAHNKGGSVESEVVTYWKLLCSSVPEVNRARAYRFKIRSEPLHPDRSGEDVPEILIFWSSEQECN
ncbi:MAG: hypothetical protein GC178_03310 [Flavobacteriales bacterium]|nr:hypothetical protein [Flavobacteriales bacterium]